MVIRAGESRRKVTVYQGKLGIDRVACFCFPVLKLFRDCIPLLLSRRKLWLRTERVAKSIQVTKDEKNMGKDQNFLE